MTPRILVVDRNQAFAAMLQEMLESEGGFTVVTAHSGSGALAKLSQGGFDLTIVDTDLDPNDLGYEELLASARQVAPYMRFMLIPFVGSGMPPDIEGLQVQGTLTKPFFVDDLLPSVRQALAQPVAASTRHSEKGPRRDQPIRQTQDRLGIALSELNRELNADTVLLLSEKMKGDPVIAHVSSLNGARLSSLAAQCIKMIEASRAAASFGGRADSSGQHSMFEDETQRLYMVGLPDDRLLVVSTPASTSLGTIRHNIRRAVRHLTEPSPD
jgi:CheY-like chemotaxis protein/predicted regulator of Ras-like GTPase activity (Roadblock/LC7/MglB family)